MKNFKINVIFNEKSIFLEDIFTKVLLKEIFMVLKNKDNLSTEGGKNWIT